MTEKTDEKIYEDYTTGGGQETRTKANILLLMADARQAERKKHEKQLKEARRCITLDHVSEKQNKDGEWVCNDKKCCKNKSCPLNEAKKP